MTFRRAVVIRASGGEVAADMEDDFHRFGVTLQHDGREVIDVEARAERYPWATCMEAPAALSAIKGAPVSPHPSDLFRHADPRLHCTHLFELAALALSSAARGEGLLTFEAEVTDPDGEARRANLFENGDLVVEWRLVGDVISEPAAYAGRSAASFGARTLAAFEPGEARRLLVLRRVVQTAKGRGMNVDAYASAADMRRPAECYSLQPGNAPRARRIAGSVRDWPDRQTLRQAVEAARFAPSTIDRR